MPPKQKVLNFEIHQNRVILPLLLLYIFELLFQIFNLSLELLYRRGIFLKHLHFDLVFSIFYGSLLLDLEV